MIPMDLFENVLYKLNMLRLAFRFFFIYLDTEFLNLNVFKQTIGHMCVCAER